MGNIVTNGMQTLNISGTAFASMKKRSIADASSALNAEKAEAEKSAAKAAKQERQDKIDARREKLDDAKLAQTQAQTDLYRARAEELRSKSEARDARTERMKDIGTPQSKEVARKVNSDMEWQAVRFGNETFYQKGSSGFAVPASVMSEMRGGTK